MSVDATPHSEPRFLFRHALARQLLSMTAPGRRSLWPRILEVGDGFAHLHVCGHRGSADGELLGLRVEVAKDQRPRQARVTDPEDVEALVISDSKTKLLYQYDDHAPPSWVGTSGGGSDQATVTGLAGSVKSVTHVPAW